MAIDLSKLEERIKLYEETFANLRRVCTRANPSSALERLERFLSYQKDSFLKEIINEYNQCDKRNFTASINKFIEKYNATRVWLHEVTIWDAEHRAMGFPMRERLVRIDNNSKGKLVVVEVAKDNGRYTDLWIFPNTTDLTSEKEVSICFNYALPPSLPKDKTAEPWYVFYPVHASPKKLAYRLLRDKMKINDAWFGGRGLIVSDIEQYIQHSFEKVGTNISELLNNIEQKNKKIREIVEKFYSVDIEKN